MFQSLGTFVGLGANTVSGVYATALWPSPRERWWSLVLVEQIGGVSRQVVESMSDIGWSIDPRSDTLGDMIRRMRAFANDVFQARNIAFHFRTPRRSEEVKLSSDSRRRITAEASIAGRLAWASD
jgi:hypothetical protein